MSGHYGISTVERPIFNVANCVVNESRGQYMHWNTCIQGGKGEIGPDTYGWTAKHDDAAAVRSRYEVVQRLLLLLL